MATINKEPKAGDSGIHELISGDPFEISDSWVDLGGEITTKGAESMGLFVDVDINTSTDVRFRALAKIEKGGSDEYSLPIRIISASEVSITEEYLELAVDADQKLVLEITLSKLIPYVQIQCQSGTAGSGQVESAKVNFK